MENAPEGRGSRGQEQALDLRAVWGLASRGATLGEIARALGGGEKTLRSRARGDAALGEALRQNRRTAEGRLFQAAMEQATGRWVEEEHPVTLKEVEYEGGKKVFERERVEVVRQRRYLPPSEKMLTLLLGALLPDLFGGGKPGGVEVVHQVPRPKAGKCS